MREPRAEAISRNLLALLRATVRPGREAAVAINPGLRRILVFADGELVASCSFDDLVGGPGASVN